MEAIEKFGYSPKELHHLLRVEEYIRRYINGESYNECLKSNKVLYLKDVKRGYYNLDTASKVATKAINNIDNMCYEYLRTCSREVDENVNELLDDVQYNIMRIAIEKEIG